MSERSTTTYDVRVVGTIWQGITAANHITVTDLMSASANVSLSTGDDEVRMVKNVARAELGDFASIDAWEITKYETTETTERFNTLSMNYAPQRGWREYTTREVRAWVVVEFTPEQEEAYADGYEDEYDESVES